MRSLTIAGEKGGRVTRFISLDPSSRETGWAIFEGEGLLDMGVITYVKGSYGGRFLFLEAELSNLWMSFGFTEVAYEGGSWGKFKVPALQVAIMTIRSWCRNQKIFFYDYAPKAIKLGIAGSGNASKDDVARAVYLHFPELPLCLPAHTTDAIAVGLVHLAWQRIKELEEKDGRIHQDSVRVQEG